MSEPTTTRKTLRQQICRAARMDFYRRYDAGEVTLTGAPTVSALASSALVQTSTNHWVGGWAYLPASGEARRITGFSPSTDQITLEYPLASSPGSGDKLEILEMWSPGAVHQAINRAIEIAARLYPVTTLDAYFQLTATGEVDLSHNVHPVRSINRVWVDPNRTVWPETGTINTTDAGYDATAHTVLAITSGLTTQAENYYAGYTLNTPAISIPITASVTFGEQTTLTLYYPTNPIPYIPDDTTFTLLSAPTTPVRPWYELKHIRVDSEEWPNTLWVEHFPADYIDRPLIIDYNTLPGALSSDTDTTIVPAEYIMRRALALLHEDAINDNRADVTRHQQLAQYFHAQADQFMTAFATQRQKVGQRFSAGTMYNTTETLDPLGWGDQ